ncbi:MAG: GNAT family N-acetyltransferase [Rhodothermales bacterium]|nr:GNAT family N-acetyltransferase [Rhodothermales bacterium]
MKSPSDRIRIRRARPDDAPLLVPLLDEVGFPATPDEISERLQTLSGPDDHVFVAAGTHNIAGVATLHFTPALHRPVPVGRITLLVVAKPHRLSGIGSMLVQACEKETAAAGGSIIEVISNLRYAEAHDFYRRLGFEYTSRKFKKYIAT